MESLLHWGIEVIKAVQTIQSPVVTGIISFVTLLGSAAAYLPVLLILYWCINEKAAIKLGAAILFSTSINTGLKLKLCVPRPFLLDPSIKIGFESTWSTPSGHAQQSAVFWGVAAVLNAHAPQRRRRAFYAAAAVVPLIIGFTRVYLGVHYPSDIIIGWVLGAVIVIAFGYALPHIPKQLQRLACRQRLILAAVIALVLIMIFPTSVSLPGALFGFIGGYILLIEHGGFSAANGTVIQKLLRILCGLVLTAGIFAVFMLIPSALAESQARLVSFAKYTVTTFTASYLAPRLFIHLNIATATTTATAVTTSSTTAIAAATAAAKDGTGNE